MRFPELTELTLRRAGWYPGRNVADKVDEWIPKLIRFGYKPFPASRQVLAEFGGIRIEQNPEPYFSGQLPLILDPTVVIISEDNRGTALIKESFDYFGEQLGEDLYPIGEDLSSHWFLAISEDGKVFALLDSMKMSGMNFDESISNMISGYQPNELEFY